MRRMASVLQIAIDPFKPPFLNSERLQKMCDGELFVTLSGNVFADQCRVVQGVCAVIKIGSRIKGKPLIAFVLRELWNRKNLERLD
jgi:hypothetical protein